MVHAPDFLVPAPVVAHNQLHDNRSQFQAATDRIPKLARLFRRDPGCVSLLENSATVIVVRRVGLRNNSRAPFGVAVCLLHCHPSARAARQGDRHRLSFLLVCGPGAGHRLAGLCCVCRENWRESAVAAGLINTASSDRFKRRVAARPQLACAWVKCYCKSPVMPPYFKTAVTEKGLEISAQVPGVRPGDLEITVEGNILRVVGDHSNRNEAFEELIQVPSGFVASKGRAEYLEGELRILLPKQ